MAILVGAEGPGLTETVMRASDLRVRIPMSRGTDSLNVATAAALAFYERARADCGLRTPRTSALHRRASSRVTEEPTPWATGLTVAAFVAAVIGAADRGAEHGPGTRFTHCWRLVSTSSPSAAWRRRCGDWRKTPVVRWFALGAGVGVSVAWMALLALGATGAL